MTCTARWCRETPRTRQRRYCSRDGRPRSRIGDTSKVVISWIVVVFLVFFNTFEGARSIDEGFVNVARLLGASEWQITRTVVIPSTMAWVFASLSPAISFALIGVIVGEFIGAERGIGRLIIESEARAEASGMMVAVIVLMLMGVALSAMIWRLQAYLLALAAQYGGVGAAVATQDYSAMACDYFVRPDNPAIKNEASTNPMIL
jgi:ABC-type proline/glycine betaine transport system permease subunit